MCGLLCIGDRLEVVGSTGQLGQAVDLVRATQPDVLLIDPRLTDVDDGESLIERIRVAAPGVHILVLTAAEPAGEAAGQSRVAAAADGYVRKTFRPSDLVAAVLAAAGYLVAFPANGRLLDSNAPAPSTQPRQPVMAPRAGSNRDRRDQDPGPDRR